MRECAMSLRSSDPSHASVGGIALLMQDFAGGGAEKVMVTLAKGLLARGHQVEIIAVRAEGPFLSHVPGEVPITVLGPSRVSRVIPALARYLRKRQPQALLSSLTHVNVAAVIARRLARVPTRLVLREENFIRENARIARRPLIRLAYRLLPTFYPSADYVIAVSEGLAREVRDVTGLPSDRVTAVYNPILTSSELELLGIPEPAPHQWFGDRKVPVILAVGRLVPQKDYVTLLEAFAIIRSDRAARLVILGAGPLHDDLVRRSRALGITGDVLFAGFRNPPFPWMKHADVLLHTARWEGLGNVIAEALACGLPVVATNCASGPAEILDEGRYGRLVPIGDVAAIAKAVVDTLSDPPTPEYLKRRAHAFTVEAIIPTYEAILLGSGVAGH
jgi:glycosyltransferase involved in cell wall biosynthesis